MAKDLSSQLSEALKAYTYDIKDKIEVAKKEEAQALVKDLKSSSPKKTGDYRKGWRMKKSRDGYVVFNKTDYRKTHLLEHGHVKAGGGRVPARVHIRPAEVKAVRTFVRRIKQVIKG